MKRIWASSPNPRKPLLSPIPRWVWVKINPPENRRFWSMFPFTRIPFWARMFDPQPCVPSARCKRMHFPSAGRPASPPGDGQAPQGLARWDCLNVRSPSWKVASPLFPYTSLKSVPPCITGNGRCFFRGLASPPQKPSENHVLRARVCVCVCV